MDEALIKLITDEELMQEAIKQVMHYWLGFYDRLFSAAGKGAIDLMFWKDDMGTQNSLLISPSHRIQQDTPTENVIAMYDVAKNFNDY